MVTLRGDGFAVRIQDEDFLYLLNGLFEKSNAEHIVTFISNSVTALCQDDGFVHQFYGLQEKCTPTHLTGFNLIIM